MKPASIVICLWSLVGFCEYN